MINEKNNKFGVILTVILTLILLGSCDPLIVVDDHPILLMRLESPGSSLVRFSDFSIVDTNDLETSIYSGELSLQKDDRGNNNYYVSAYTYFLEEGKSYKVIKYKADGVESTHSITIENARNGMVYFVRIYEQ